MRGEFLRPVGKRHIEVQTALPNYLTTATIFWKGKDYADIAVNAGYEGIQYHPIRPNVPVLRDLAVASMDIGLRAAIRSGHQGFRQGKTIGEVRRHTNKVVATQAFLMMPETMESLDDLAQLQTDLGRPLPLVTYPTKSNAEIHITDSTFVERVFQPTTDVLTTWNIAIQGRNRNQILNDLIEEYQKEAMKACVLIHFIGGGKKN